MSEITREDAIAHFGTKGMKWGVRKSNAGGGGSGSGPQKLTRKEVKMEKKQFYENKANHILKTAVDHPDVLIGVSNGSPIPTIVTGREFVHHMSRGGQMNVRYTDIYATKSNGTYFLNPTPNQKFVRSDKKK